MPCISKNLFTKLPNFLAMNITDAKKGFPYYIKTQSGGDWVIIFDEVNKLYPKLEWLKDSKGRLKKSNYDIADSITCGIAVLNQKNK